MKKARIFLTDDIYPAIKCSLCDLYLSVGPVLIQADKPICGRCRPSSYSPEKVAHFYEKFAQFMYFSCIYDAYGCDVKLSWGSVLQHEGSCKFAPVECPAINCEDKIRTENIKEHFLLKHENLIHSENQFKVPCKQGDENHIKKLYYWQKKPFILEINYAGELCNFSISCFDGERNEELFFDLALYDETHLQRIHLDQHRISKYSAIPDASIAPSKLDIISLTRILNKDELTCVFFIRGLEEPKTDPLNESLLTDLECPICMEYMKPPIYNCEVGHSICNVCKSNITKCPVCSMHLKKSRNFSLEKVSERVVYPCKYQKDGCNFYGNLYQIISHESLCTVYTKLQSMCYVALLPEPCTCHWKGRRSDMLTHIELIHPRYFVNIIEPISLKINKKSTVWLFATYDNEIFKLCFIISEELLEVAVKILNKSEHKAKYQFHLNFLDNLRQIIHLTKNCTVADPNNHINDSCLVIQKKIIMPFIKNDKLNIKIDIVKF